jgi:RimJ/RimL family protein N-acetyltransferase
MNYWQSKHIRLRAVEPADAITFHEWNLDSERARMLDFVWPPVSLSAEHAWTEEQAKRKLENDAYHWVIETLEGQPIGSISTHHCQPRNGTFSYGIDICAEQRGHGYASEAIKLVLRYYFEELRYQKVTVAIHADNTASIRLHEKLGFQREGLLRRMQFTHGKFIDELWYGMTFEEFQERWRNHGTG